MLDGFLWNASSAVFRPHNSRDPSDKRRPQDDKKEKMPSASSVSSALGVLLLQLRHHALDERLRVIQILHDDLDVHGWLADLARALAIDAVLADEGECVSQ